jgi:hypothetical protein
MKRKYFRIIFSILIIIIISCAKEKEITAPSLSHGKINIATDQEIYYWEDNVENKILIIKGELKNNSTSTFLSKVGDSFGPSDIICFVKGSDGKLEKYNTTDHNWYERMEILDILTEGSSIMQIEPSNIYSIIAPLYINAENYLEETGKYRLRLDYYDLLDQVKITPFYDYSNIFEIQAE